MLQLHKMGCSSYVWKPGWVVSGWPPQLITTQHSTQEHIPEALNCKSQIQHQFFSRQTAHMCSFYMPMSILNMGRMIIVNSEISSRLRGLKQPKRCPGSKYSALITRLREEVGRLGGCFKVPHHLGDYLAAQ